MRVGSTVELGYVSQTRRGLDPNKSVFEVTPPLRPSCDHRMRLLEQPRNSHVANRSVFE